MPEFISSPSFLWFVLGLVFLLAELGAPGFIMIFFGFGAWTASLAAWLLGVGLAVQIAIFLVAALLYLALLRRVWMRAFTGSSDAAEAELADQPSNLGAVVEVTRDVGPSAPGEIKYRGTFWRAVADEHLAAGASAVIIGESEQDRSTFRIGPYKG